MSLFSSRQWWHTRLGSGEEFDQGSICVANIDNDPIGTGAHPALCAATHMPSTLTLITTCHALSCCSAFCPNTVKVVTGSLQGVLRVHQPHQQRYHIEDILLEAQMDSSILQLAAGNFLGYVLTHADVLLLVSCVMSCQHGIHA